jgi:hypothetical protein
VTIDERLAALTMTVELLAGMQKTTEQNLAQLTERMDRLTEHMTGLTVTMNRRANIVIRHEERLDALDGGEK